MKGERFSQKSKKNFQSISSKNFNENFRFRPHFRWLNENFVNKIEQKFGNPNIERLQIYLQYAR